MDERSPRSRTLASVATFALVGLVLSTPVAAQIQDEITVTDGLGAPGSFVSLQVLLDNDAICQGFAFGACHDPTKLGLVDVMRGETTILLNPDFEGVDEYVDGFISRVVISFLGAVQLPPGDDLELYVATYEVLAGSTTSTTVEFCDTLGDPPVETVIVHEGESVVPEQFAGTVTIGAFYRRGDTNADGNVDVGDVIFLESYLFIGGAEPACLATVDVNDDTQLDIADSISLLSWLFSGGAVPPEPFTACGLDDTPIPCSSFTGDLCP